MKSEKKKLRGILIQYNTKGRSGMKIIVSYNSNEKKFITGIIHIHIL